MMDQTTGSGGLVRAWMAPEAGQFRALLLELHRAAGNHPELRELLDEWQVSHSAPLVERFGFSPARIKMLNLFMMGLLHLEDLGVLEADHDELVAEAVAAVLPLTRR
jgi:hypothetical protein